MVERGTARASAPARRRRPQAPARGAAARARRAQRILVPVDGSANSLRALEYVAGRRGSADRPLQLTVLNVQPQLRPSLHVSRRMIDEHYASQSQAVLEPVRRFLARKKLPADVRVLVGAAAPTIVDLARHLRCGEIVIGTRGLGSLQGLLLGSVTTKVIQLSKIPVTVVP